MLDREWVSLTDPDEPHERYLFDVSFLTSSYACIYGRGCPGTEGVEGDDRGCCRFGAHFVDDADRDRTVEMVQVLGPDYMQHHARAQRKGVVVTEKDGSQRTRMVDGACIFLNRAGWSRGAGCALHQYAMDRDEHFVNYKPEVCWLVPLRREVQTDWADDGEERVTTTVTSYDRGAWGDGGSEFDWWCTTDDDRAYQGSEPVYRSMKRELVEMSSPAVYAELARYLDDRVATPPSHAAPDAATLKPSVMEPRQIAAPQLRETADIWWDSGHDPVIRWDASGRRYWLVDGDPAGERQDRLTLLVIPAAPPVPPDVIAQALRDGLAACDFPPTEPGVPAARARATLRAAGVRLD